jgi:S-adenosylmethionine:tRNA ribosyltransferase-isomerase
VKTSDFFFELPPRLIAQYPPEQRGQSRLMTLDRVTGKREHRAVTDLGRILKSGDLLVFNNSKVRKARLLGVSAQTGARVEFLLLSVVSAGGRRWKAMVRRAKRRKSGSVYVFYGEGGEAARAEITGGEGEFRVIEFDRPVDEDWLEKHGHIPLPPYIRRDDAGGDAERYQTVYAAVTGSAAAPTAGLHFTRELLDELAARGVESAFITLHVGPGTFLPVRSGRVEDHVMHEEMFSIDPETAAKIDLAKAEGRRIIAAGTTSVRALESAWDAGRLRPGEGSTSIFLYPGCRFNVIDALFTNFHTPESTLLMLVSAFAGRELILESYACAIQEGYRFFSYGDAMLIL